jgi:hypothetical protein
MFPEIETYIKRTGQEEVDITSGYSFFGTERVLELVAEAERENKKLVFYYATEQDEKMDNLSYRFE